jgi:hypothetical protein
MGAPQPAVIQFPDWPYPQLAVVNLDVTDANGRIRIGSKNSLKGVVMRRTDKHTRF